MDYRGQRPPLLTSDVMIFPRESLGATEAAGHHVILQPGRKPVYIPAYRLTHSQRQVVDKQGNEMLRRGIIQYSRLPLYSPFFLVPQKDRLVIDFRKAIDATEDDRYYIPVLSDLLVSSGHSNYILSSLTS